MRKYLKNKRVLRACEIYKMLDASAKRKHTSFHTPGHKVGAWDITELSYSDNLSCPRGCIAQAEKDIARILGAEKSFILTDGSTSGVFAVLRSAKCAGVKTVLALPPLHKSVYNACETLGLTLLISDEADGRLLDSADALLCTSPDYYGRIPDLKKYRSLCDERGKLLLLDGAHGGHLHFDKTLYAGAYADFWVDGVHKSLPALTQGGVVSARTEAGGKLLEKSVDIFRTTSPSYPIMASVEYAVKYPRNEALERAVRAFAKSEARGEVHGDWTKLCARFGKSAFRAEKDLERKGIYPEFCDGEYIVFYLSPATKGREFARLKKALRRLFEICPYEEKRVQQNPAPRVCTEGKKIEWVALEESAGRVCACKCGLFPPCTPLIYEGERIEERQIRLLQSANNIFGLSEGKIAVVKEDEEA